MSSFDAVIKLWPVIAALVAGAGGALAWIGVGVWRVSQWTTEHDSRVAGLQHDVVRIETRVDRLEVVCGDHREAIARHIAQS
jgi:hypothetical protein